MKILFFLLVILHGLIHLLGAFKAFHWMELKELPMEISKTSGIAWFITSLLFLVTAGFYLLSWRAWWIFGGISIVISQCLIIQYWEAAKYGTIANGIIFLVVFISWMTWRFYHQYQTDVNACLNLEKNTGISLVTEADIRLLPAPVQKYMRYTGCIGQPKVHNFKVTFKGKIRKDEHSEWMPFTSEQYNFMNDPARLFFMRAKMKKMPVSGYHKFIHSKASMDIRLMSLFKVQYLDGEEMNKAETVTFFNDMCCMAPATLIDERISWDLLSDHKVKATFYNGDITISAELIFNDTGQLINFISPDRYNAEAKRVVPWETPLRNYTTFNQYCLPGYAEAVYIFEDHSLCYGIFECQQVEYNVRR